MKPGRCIPLEQAVGLTIEAVVDANDMFVIAFDNGDWAEVQAERDDYEGVQISSEGRSGFLYDVLTPEEMHGASLITDSAYQYLVDQRKARKADEDQKRIAKLKAELEVLEAASASNTVAETVS